MKIILVNGVRAHEEFILSAPHLRIGRELDNDISLLSGGLSRYHSKIFLKDNQWFLEDLGSTNGTFLNKQPVRAPMILHDGDVISMSEQVIEVKRTPDDPLELVPPVAEPPAVPTFQLNLAPDSTFQIPMTPVFSSKPEVCSIPVSNSVTPISTPVEMAAPVIDLQGLDTSALFAGADRTLKMDDAGKVISQDEPHKKSNMFFNIFLLIIAVLGLLVVILVIISLDQGKKREGQALLASHSTVNEGVPLTLHFERQKEINGNLFRFEFRIDFGHKARLKIFEVNSNVRYDTKFRELRLKSEASSEEIDGITLHQLELNDLEKTIRESGFFQCTENSLSTKGNDYFYINICLGKESNELFEYSNAPPRSIERIEEAVSKFSLAVLKVGFTRPFEELLEECKMMYEVARDKYSNAEGDDRNLVEASKCLKYIISALQVFDKKPSLYLDAEKLQKEVMSRRDQKINVLHGAAVKSYSMREYAKARNYNVKILSLLDKDDEEDRVEYEKKQRNLIQIESMMNNDLRGIK